MIMMHFILDQTPRPREVPWVSLDDQEMSRERFEQDVRIIQSEVLSQVVLTFFTKSCTHYRKNKTKENECMIL